MLFKKFQNLAILGSIKNPVFIAPLWGLAKFFIKKSFKALTGPVKMS